MELCVLWSTAKQTDIKMKIVTGKTQEPIIMKWKQWILTSSEDAWDIFQISWNLRIQYQQQKVFDASISTS